MIRHPRFGCPPARHRFSVRSVFWLPLFVLMGIPVVLAARGGEPRLPPLRVAHLGNLTHAPVLIARERRLFEQAALPRTVEWKMFGAGPQIIEALFAREIDLAWIGPMPAVTGFVRSNGEALRILSGLTQGGAGLVARRGSGFVDPSRLSRRRLATPQAGNTQDLSLRHWIKTHGGRLREQGGDVEILPMPGADQLILFQRGEIDGAWAVEPWLSRLIQEGPGELLVDEATLWPDGRYSTTVLIARPELIDADPALITRWLSTQEELLAWMSTHPDLAREEANAALIRLTGRGLSPLPLRAAWTRLRFSSDPARASIEEGARLAGEFGLLGRGRVDLSGLFALGLLESLPGRKP